MDAKARLKIEKTASFDEVREIMKSTGYENSILSAISHVCSLLKHDDEKNNLIVLQGFSMSMFAVGYDICRALHEKGGQ